MSPLLSSRFVFYCNIQAGIPPSSSPPFLPPVSLVPSPIATPGELGRRSFHAGAQTLYFQQKPASEGDGRQAGAALGSGPAAGSPPAPAPARAELTEEPGAAAAAAAAAPGPHHLPMLPARRRGGRGSAVLQARERLPGPNAAGCFVQPRAQGARGERAHRGSAQEACSPRRRLLARPPPLCRAPPGTQVRWHSSAEGHGARRPLERSPSARQRHAGCREKGSVSGSREGSHQAQAVERALRGSPEPSPGLSASFKPSGSRPQLERRARNLKTLYSPRFPQPSPSPCESWGLPCPPAPSARWVFFLVFL